MNIEEINNFVDCMTYEDCTVRFRGRTYWCEGVTWETFDKGPCSLSVWECENEPPYDYIRDVLICDSMTKDECMKHFLEDKYWDGKSFYEVAHEIEWVDL